MLFSFENENENEKQKTKNLTSSSPSLPISYSSKLGTHDMGPTPNRIGITNEPTNAPRICLHWLVSK
jgi:hypothetical protein